MSLRLFGPSSGRPFYLTASYFCASVLVWMTQGFGMNMTSVNIPQIAGAFGASISEATWLNAAYMAPNVSLSILLVKIRNQFGLRMFTVVSIVSFSAAALLHVYVVDLRTAVILRFFAGIAAAPMSTLGMLYMMEAFPPALKPTWAISLSLTCSTIGSTFTRLISTSLLDYGQWKALSTMELGLALCSLAAVLALHLTPIARENVLEVWDFVSYPLLAIGFGLIAIVLVQGTNYWWFEVRWIGVCSAVAIASICAALLIELHRSRPLIDLQWLTHPIVLRFAVTLVLFRFVLSEQTAGAYGLFRSFGLLGEQSRSLYVAIIGATILGGLLCGAIMEAKRTALLPALALALISSGAYVDSHSTVLTRPENMYLSQALIALGGILFLPPALSAGTALAQSSGPMTMSSFVAVFLLSQNLGALAGSAAFGSFVVVRERVHSSRLIEPVLQSNPIVAQQLDRINNVYRGVLPDDRLRSAEAVANVARRQSQQATVLAYNDAFLLIALCAAGTLGILVLGIILGYRPSRVESTTVTNDARVSSNS